jgi:hypothetical protein
LVAVVEQFADNRAAHESGRSGDENTHDEITQIKVGSEESVCLQPVPAAPRPSKTDSGRRDSFPVSVQLARLQRRTVEG